MAVHSELVDRLSAINLSDTARPGGIRARVEEATEIIHEEFEAAHTGRPADVLPLPTTTARSTAA